MFFLKTTRNIRDLNQDKYLATFYEVATFWKETKV